MPEPFVSQQITQIQLWHFMYKNVISAQVFFASSQKPFISDAELNILYSGYFNLAEYIRKRKKIKSLFYTMERYTLYTWITPNFELYCTFNPLTSHSTVVETADRLLKFLRKEEKRFFLLTSPGLLLG